jgi:hypothetical protein
MPCAARYLSLISPCIVIYRGKKKILKIESTSMNHEQVLDLFLQRYMLLASSGSPTSMEIDIYRKILMVFHQYGFNPKQTLLQRVTEVGEALIRLVGETDNSVTRLLIQRAIDDLEKETKPSSQT